MTVHKEMFSFHFQFQFNLTSNDIKVENMSKSNCMPKMKISHKVRNTGKHDFHRFFIFF